jgi:hypothetical protein
MRKTEEYWRKLETNRVSVGESTSVAHVNVSATVPAADRNKLYNPEVLPLLNSGLKSVLLTDP